ncbi:MAG: recombinase RecF, partial [Oscillibacter sp.]|nr:recombinase RecF [Oscillibacter sp.]
AAYEETEKGLHLCGLFIKSKVRMLTDRINGKFRSVRFRLFVEQVNGGVKDDCEVLVPSADGSQVPYRDANNAARINAGLEIIEALSNHWHTYMPVFIDNAESVTRLVQTETQTIRLVVSEPDKKLRLELDSAA